jgi:hypothetical protein
MSLRRSILLLAFFFLLPILFANAQDLPTLELPEDNADCVSLTVTFNWSDVANVTYYTIQISQFADFATLEDESTNLTSSSYSSNVLQYEETYYWRIITNYTDNTSSTTNAFRFTTKMAAPEPDLPDNFQDCLNRAVQFTWSEVENTERYHLQVSTASTFGQDDLVIDKDDLEQLTWTDVIFEYGTVYYWRIKAFAECETDWSLTRQFRVKDAPPAAIYPENEEECLPRLVTLEWLELNETDTYSLQLSTNSDFDEDDLLIDEIDLTQNTYQFNLPDYYTTYYWRVKAFIGDCETNWSDPYEFKTAQEVPIPELPEDTEEGVPLNQKISWDINGEPLYYNLMVSVDLEFNQLIVDQENIEVKYYDLDLDASYYNTNFYWKVQAVYDDCSTEWSEVFHFRTRYQAAELTEPIDSKICVPLQPKLMWEAVNGATSYRVQVATDNDFINLVVNEQPVSNTFLEPVLQDGETAHYWRVRGDDDYNTGEWSESRLFTTTYKTPELTYPPNNAGGQERQVNFEWNKVHDNVTYEIIVSKDRTFDDITMTIVEEDNIIGETFFFEMPGFYQTYYWRVKANGLQGCNSAWSETYSFRTIIPSPDLIYPGNNQTDLPLSVVFSWENIEDAKTYEINLATDPDFEDIVFGQVGVQTNTILARNLLEFQDYYWRVNASNPDGTSEWSETFKFTTGGQGPEKVKLEFPLKGAEKVQLNIAARWKAASLAESYTLQIAENQNFFNPVVDESGILDLSYDLTTEPLENFKQYYWRVQAVNANGVSEWSDVWNFRTIALAPQSAPELIKPQREGFNEPIALEFEWSEVQDATSYQLQLASENTFSPEVLIVDQKRIYSTTRFIQGLSWETNYFWRVRAENEAGSGPWSEVRSFETMVSVNENVNKYLVDVVPNPVTQSASIQFVLPEATETAIEIFDMDGRLVDMINSGFLSAGSHNFTWNPDALQSGSYLVHITVGKEKAVKQVILTK